MWWFLPCFKKTAWENGWLRVNVPHRRAEKYGFKNTHSDGKQYICQWASMKLAFDKISFPFCLKNFNPCNASSGSVYISACVQPRISPCAALSPVRTPNPYPSFSSTRTLRQPGYRGSRPRSTSGLLSVEPLSTRRLQHRRGVLVPCTGLTAKGDWPPRCSMGSQEKIS